MTRQSQTRSPSVRHHLAALRHTIFVAIFCTRDSRSQTSLVTGPRRQVNGLLSWPSPIRGNVPASPILWCPIVSVSPSEPLSTVGFAVCERGLPAGAFHGTAPLITAEKSASLLPQFQRVCPIRSTSPLDIIAVRNLLRSGLAKPEFISRWGSIMTILLMLGVLTLLCVVLVCHSGWSPSGGSASPPNEELFKVCRYTRRLPS